MLLGLPDEILALVLSPLSLEDLVACKSVCHVLNSAVRRDVYIQYKLALAAYGLCDNELSVSAVGQKLERAHLFHRALRNIRWIPHFTLTLEGQRLDYPSSPVVHRDMQPPGSLSLMYSGSSLRGAPERCWTFEPPPATVFTYTFNPSEDLVVLQTSDVPQTRHHLLTMSTGTPHPEAARPYLKGETIALDSTTFGTYLFIHGLGGLHTLWNWKTGEVVTNMRCHYYAVAFLDQDHLAISAMTRGAGLALLVYRLPLTIYDEVKNKTQPPHYMFGLPTLTSQTHRPDPSLCSLRRGFSLPPLSSVADPGDFHTNPDDVLLSVESAQLAPSRQYEFFIPLRVLRALLTPEHRGTYIPWKEWGPQYVHATPLLRHPPIVGWRSHCVFGMRRIGMYPTQREDGLLVAKIYDYHPRRVALARQEQPPNDSHWKVVDGETVLGEWHQLDSLETHLPYIEIEVPLPEELQRHRGSMLTLGINDNGIVACTDFVAARPHLVHVYTF